MEKLIRIDKNGTKYYESDVCPKCGGTGHLNCYEYVEGGVCFLCGGTGNYYTKWSVRTPEYEKLLADRRLQRAIKKAPELNRAFLEKNGVSEDGKMYVVRGRSYEIKDELKEQGAKFMPLFGWHFPKKPEQYDTFEVTVDEVARKDITEKWQLLPSEEIKAALRKKDLETRPKTKSEYIGKEGEKVTLECVYKGQSSYFTHFSHYGEEVYLYRFDADGSTVVWKTSKEAEFSEGEKYTLTGTVKEHKEYGGDKETVLVRVKIG